MKARLKMLRRILVARERIRDAAAAELAVAEGKRQQEESRVRSAEELREEMIRESDERLKIAAHIAEIETLGIELGRADESIGRAETELGRATKKTEEAAGVLRSCERAVRLSERLVTETRKDVSKAADKNEQAMVDDIIASRWSKTE